MPTYKYALIITGTVEAPNDVHAKQQILMGVTVSTRLLQTPHDIVIQLQQGDAPTATPQESEEDG